MIGPQKARFWGSVMPWLGAALLWFALIAPMRSDQESRLAGQERLRREGLSAEQSLREIQSLRVRVARALSSACLALSDPAALRQRSVAATAGLALSAFNLSVTGGTGGGAGVEAAGTHGVLTELLRRLNDPARGGFLRSASLRNSGGRWSLSAGTGVLDTFPGRIMPSPGPCPLAPDPAAPDGEPARQAVPPPRSGHAVGRSVPTPAPESTTPASDFAPAPTPPFTLVAFLSAPGQNRVSVAVRGEVRVVSVGDRIEGWTCVSIDRDEGAVFTSASGERLLLKGGP